MKVCFVPGKADLGIGRVIEAYKKHLPDFGITVVDNENAADLIAVHAGAQATARQPDVLHCHGLYPTATLDTGKQFFQANADVIDNVRSAKVVTVPSEWVADIFRRDMLSSPIVLPHGIDIMDWRVSNRDAEYVLWSKGHKPGVCDPTVVYQVAERLPDVKFLLTFGEKAFPNIEVIGMQPFDKMVQFMSNCSAYLAVTKETFGIQTLEAMALGKPIVGFDWGGTAEIVEHGYSGWLAKPGDIDNLVEGIEWTLANRRAAGLNARSVVEREFSWHDVCATLAGIYHDALNDNHDGPKVSVVIPCFNYEDRVANAIESALNQHVDGGFEIIVVDDGSTDGSLNVIERYKDRVTVVRQQNSGVAEARNCGIRHASGEFVACLDADDEMAEDVLSLFVKELDADRSIGLVYGGLRSVYDSGAEHSGDWPPDFCFKRQAIGHNQIPSFCMYRKDAWKRAGGYRAKYTPAEDAELWLRIASCGYDAKKVTEDITYTYNVHAGSLSRVRKEPDWVGDKPWAFDQELTPFAAPACDHKNPSFPVRNYDDPWVSVIIPVGPGHEHIVWRAIESVQLQTLPYWELVVVNDSGEDLFQPSTGQPLQQAYPFIKLLDVPDNGNVSKARNLGASQARAPFLVFLDADDWMDKDYLSSVIDAYNLHPDCYIYTDWYVSSDKSTKHQARNFDCERLKLEAIHAVTALVPKAWHEEIGGFDEEFGDLGWEDWDYYLKMVVQHGHCGYRVPIPLMTYDSTMGVRRDESFDRKDRLLPIIRGRYASMGCRGCGSKAGAKKSSRVHLPAPAAPIDVGGAGRVRQIVKLPTNIKRQGRGVPLPRSKDKSRGGVKMQEANMVTVVENSGNMGAHGVIGAITRKKYGRKCHGQQFQMDIRDARAQPHWYVIVDAASSVQGQQMSLPSKPVPPAEPVVSRPPAPSPVVEPLKVENVEEKEEKEEKEAFNADEDGIDISLLSLTQIKQLGLDSEDAAIAYEEEAMSKGRKTVLAYLEGLAGDWLTDEDE